MIMIGLRVAGLGGLRVDSESADSDSDSESESESENDTGTVAILPD